MLDGKILTPSLPKTGAGKPVTASTNSTCTPSSALPVTDSKTIAYFDKNTPEYHSARLGQALEAIRRHADADSSLVEVGCGVGNILERIGQQTPVRRLCGIDVSQKCLERTRARLKAQGLACETHEGSILDEGFISTLAGRFDVVVAAALLHHLIGRTRSESRRLAEAALANCVRLVRSGGYIIVAEPVYYPKLTMDLVFWIKRLITTVTDERVSFFGHWNNLGAPVVSYYRTEDIIEMMKEHENVEVRDCHLVDKRRSLLFKLAMITAHKNATIVVQKTG